MPVARDLQWVAEQLDTRVMLVGAYARDRCLGDIEPTRGTTDADFALQAADCSGVDHFGAACQGRFQGFDAKELKMYHVDTGLKVDLVPCGAIEQPAGTLRVRGATRELNTVGLLECFELGAPIEVALDRVLVPPATGFLLVKLLAYQDRAAPRDLRDFGYVLRRFSIDEDAVFDDEGLMNRFDAGTLVWGARDIGPWQAGRAIAASFSRDAVTAFGGALRHVANCDPPVRTCIVEGVNVAPDERLALADRMLAILSDAVSAQD